MDDATALSNGLEIIDTVANGLEIIDLSRISLLPRILDRSGSMRECMSAVGEEGGHAFDRSGG